MKKFLFLSTIIFLEVIALVSINNTPTFAQAGGNTVEHKAPGSKCDRNKHADCVSGYICNADNMSPNFQTCIKDENIQEGDKGCRADQFSNPDYLNPAPRYSTCTPNTECKNGTCTALPFLKENQTGCKYDSSSNHQNLTKDNVKSTCAEGLKCTNGTCTKDASKKLSCQDKADSPCKGDTTSTHGNFKESELCCDNFQCWNGKCVDRNDQKLCKKEGEDAEGDSTTTSKVLAPDKKCCQGLRLKDGKCTKEIACLDTGAKCDKAQFKCCGEMACVNNKCQEGLPDPPSPPCAQGAFQNGKCTAVPTALGSLSTNPEGFIKSLFAVLLSLSGGIALLLIIKSGYIIMTANGKPEAIQSGRDQLIAAVVGLIFLIFSFVILQAIGVDILHIPGFK